jgi:hypothetical protein
MNTAFKFFASLRLTVVLLALSMVLIFFGTLDQVHYGIWHTQKLYFESFLAVWSYPEQAPYYDKLFWLHLPMPGGYLLGGLLLINLVAAHFNRFKLSVKKSGIFLIHFGLILLLLSEVAGATTHRLFGIMNWFLSTGATRSTTRSTASRSACSSPASVSRCRTHLSAYAPSAISPIPMWAERKRPW